MNKEQPEQPLLPENDKSWIAPLVTTILHTAPLHGSMGPILCPICDCDHQQFKGMGLLAPDKTGSKLVTMFPTAETMAKIDMPPEVKIGGMILYVRYSCGCNGHSWAYLEAFQEEKTVIWSVNLTPTPPKPKKGGKTAANLPPPDLHPQSDVQEPPAAPAGTVQSILQALGGIQGSSPIIIFGPGIVQYAAPAPGAPPPVHLPAQLQASMMPHTPPAIVQPPQVQEEVDDHESINNRVPAQLKFIWCNWCKEPKFISLPIVPLREPPVKGPPFLAAGNKDVKELATFRKWLFAVAVEIGDLRKAVHSLVMWDKWLIVVSDSKDRETLAKGIADHIISLGTFKPDLWIVNRKEYSKLVRLKVNQLKKGT